MEFYSLPPLYMANVLIISTKIHSTVIIYVIQLFAILYFKNVKTSHLLLLNYLLYFCLLMFDFFYFVYSAGAANTFVVVVF